MFWSQNNKMTNLPLGDILGKIFKNILNDEQKLQKLILWKILIWEINGGVRLEFLWLEEMVY